MAWVGAAGETAPTQSYNEGELESQERHPSTDARLAPARFQPQT
jgi:hypothetical protein